MSPFKATQRLVLYTVWDGDARRGLQVGSTLSGDVAVAKN